VFLLQISMSGSGVTPPLTTHILDTATGKPAALVPMVLSIQDQNGNNYFNNACFNTNKII
jgi:5-hydroxyisourate hydrolase-like protein (transthyretin family)